MPRFQEKAQLEDLRTVDMRVLKQQIPKGTRCESVTVDGIIIKLSASEPQYGGLRHWLVCPSCLSRRVCLYRYRSRWQCRECCGLLYRSQSYDKKSQAILQSERLELKLNGDGSKPPYMRWSTYDRICDEINYYQDLYSQHAMQGLYARIASASLTGRSIGAILKRSLKA